MFIRFKSNIMKPNKERIFKKVHTQIIKVWKECVKAFIEETVKHIHVDTGMSMASLQPLAVEVGLKTMIVQSLKGKGPKRGFKNITNPDFSDNISKYKSRALGQRLGRKGRAYQLSFGTPQSPQFTFHFQIAVFQWYLHDSFANWSAGQNWQALEYGRQEFIRTWNNIIQKYIDLNLVFKHEFTRG